MAKINFYLKGSPSKELLEELQKTDKSFYYEQMSVMRPIVCSVSFGGRREIISTRLFMNLLSWDSKKQEVKANKDAPANRKKINDMFVGKKREIANLIEEYQMENIYIEKEKLLKFFEEDKPDDSLDTIENVFKRFKAEHKTNDGFSIKYRTIQKYSTLTNHMINFQKDNKFIPNRITNDWVIRFRKYLMDEELNDNTVAKYIVGLKTLKKFLQTIGVKISADMDQIKAVEKEQIVNILEKKELEILEEFEFKNSVHAQVRDVFLFQCYTGQRYSDIEKISRKCITTKDEYPVWLVSTQKTDDNLTVPLNSKAILILEKYKDLETPLPRFTNSDFNNRLKEMAKEAELNRIVKRVYFYDNRKKEVTQPIHEIISSHMARKSFISLSIQRGIPERFVRKISAHKTERSFIKYVNLGSSHLDAILKAWN